jgi:hypothetical protein
MRTRPVSMASAWNALICETNRAWSHGLALGFPLGEATNVPTTRGNPLQASLRPARPSVCVGIDRAAGDSEEKRGELGAGGKAETLCWNLTSMGVSLPRVPP